MNNRKDRELIQAIYDSLPMMCELHSPNNPILKLLQSKIQSYFSNRETDKVMIAPYSDVVFPTVSVGNFTSDNYLYAIEEFVIRSFYSVNVDRYKTFFDIGSNVGSDALFAGSLGWDVSAFEPDPYNFGKLEDNILINGFTKSVKVYRRAFSDVLQEMNFVCVKGNTTASHVVGARDYYGDADVISVNTITFDEIGFYPDLIKMNIEGHESVVLTSIPLEQWRKLDCFVALHSKDIREEIYEHFMGNSVNLFSQKLGWKKAYRASDLSLEKDGYVFISTKDEMPW